MMFPEHNCINLIDCIYADLFSFQRLYSMFPAIVVMKFPHFVIPFPSSLNPIFTRNLFSSLLFSSLLFSSVFLLLSLFPSLNFSRVVTSLFFSSLLFSSLLIFLFSSLLFPSHLYSLLFPSHFYSLLFSSHFVFSSLLFSLLSLLFSLSPSLHFSFLFSSFSSKLIVVLIPLTFRAYV